MIVIDVEIKKAILGRGETPVPGIEYCGGWRDFENMGISCVCTHDIVTHRSRVFLAEDLVELAAYLHGKPTAGFNTKRFDLPLLRKHGVGIDFGPAADGMHYDMLEQIWLALGLNPDKFVPKTHGGWGLDAVCQATLGIAKTGNGALAPVWWQQGQRGQVIDYCLNDVWMEGQLLSHIIKHGWVTRKVTEAAAELRVKRPFDVGLPVVYTYADNTIGLLQSAGVKLRPSSGEGVTLGFAQERYGAGGYVPGPGKQPDNSPTSGTGGSLSPGDPFGPSGLGIIR
jgi:hypothetical protein